MKIILVTGSTDGIGREAARQLGERGHRVLVHGRRYFDQTTEARASTVAGDRALQQRLYELSLARTGVTSA